MLYIPHLFSVSHEFHVQAFPDLEAHQAAQVFQVSSPVIGEVWDHQAHLVLLGLEVLM